MRANSFGLEVCLYEIVYGELTQVLLCCFVSLILPTQCIKRYFVAAQSKNLKDIKTEISVRAR